jgi:pimeloyl-ACP methyl ester carboxylesterase
MEALDLKNAMLVGHSTGGGVVARYMARYGSKRVAKVVLIGSATPLVLKTPENPNGTPIEVLDGFRQAVVTNRAQFFKDLAIASTTTKFGAAYSCNSIEAKRGMNWPARCSLLIAANFGPVIRRRL